MIALLFVVGALSQERPLAYYLTDPCLRRVSAERFMPCSAPLRKIKAQARLAGKIREFENDQAEIYDVEYTREGSSQADARSVLAGPSATQLREIHRQVNNGGTFLPTELCPRNSRWHWIKARWRSSGGSITEEYVQRRNEQWLPMDFRPVFEAAREVLPNGDGMVSETASLDLETRVYRINTQGGGDIEVPFRIEEQVIPTTARFHLGEDAPRLWTRRVSSAKGDYADAVVPHPLRYFYPHPCLRRDPQEQSLAGALSCLPSDRASLLTVKSKLREVGKIGEFRVYEIDYRGKIEELDRKIRTVLVGRSLDALYETWLHDSTFSTGDAFPVKIVMVGGTQPLIETNFDDGGMYVFNYEKFFWLGPRGPQPVDFSAVGTAAQQAIPKTEGLHQPTTDHGITRLRWASGTFELKYGFRKTACCVGTVEVPYTIEEGIAKPVAGKAIYRHQWTY